MTPPELSYCPELPIRNIIDRNDEIPTDIDLLAEEVLGDWAWFREFGPQINPTESIWPAKSGPTESNITLKALFDIAEIQVAVVHHKKKSSIIKTFKKSVSSFFFGCLGRCSIVNVGGVSDPVSRSTFYV
jgi:hypothetical protein